MSVRNRPVPAAHLSFIAKSATLPSASSTITFVSWPPRSATIRARPQGAPSQNAPRAAAEISVTTSPASRVARRP